MTQMMQDLLVLDSQESMCRELGSLLGLDDPVPSKVLVRAQVDDRFAMHLAMSRGRPELLRLHLNDPKNDEFGLPPTAYREAPIPRFTDRELLGKVASSLARWGSAGFKRLDPAVVESRLRACRACPNLSAPPDRLLYKVALVTTSDPRVCNACGCVASNKAKVATESCPLGIWGPAA
jgi:hypothetical protein